MSKSVLDRLSPIRTLPKSVLIRGHILLQVVLLIGHNAESFFEKQRTPDAPNRAREFIRLRSTMQATSRFVEKSDHSGPFVVPKLVKIC